VTFPPPRFTPFEEQDKEGKVGKNCHFQELDKISST
jgi:hypothetical protein